RRALPREARCREPAACRDRRVRRGGDRRAPRRRHHAAWRWLPCSGPNSRAAPSTFMRSWRRPDEAWRSSVARRRTPRTAPPFGGALAFGGLRAPACGPTEASARDARVTPAWRSSCAAVMAAAVLAAALVSVPLSAEASFWDLYGFNPRALGMANCQTAVADD